MATIGMIAQNEVANQGVILDYTEWRRDHLEHPGDTIESISREAEEISRRLRSERANMDAAIRMLDDGLLPIDKIAAYCDLPPEAVQRLASRRTIPARRSPRT